MTMQSRVCVSISLTDRAASRDQHRLPRIVYIGDAVICDLCTLNGANRSLTLGRSQLHRIIVSPHSI